MLLPMFVFQTIAPSEPFKFASDIVWSFQICKIADEHLKTSSSEDPVTMMKDLLVYSAGIKQANSLLDTHRRSQDTLISQSANALSNVYSEIYENNRSLVAFIEETLNDPGKANSQQGTWSRKLSENAATNEELWRKFPLSIALATHALVDNKSTMNGKLYRLRITKSELEQLRKKLTDIFGNQIAQGPNAGQFPLEASGALLYLFLNKGWKPSDSK